MGKVTKAQKIMLAIPLLILLIPITFGIIYYRDKNECLRKIVKDGIITLGYLTHYYHMPNNRSLIGYIEYTDGKKEYQTETLTLLD